MKAVLTLVHYRKGFIPFGLLSMAFFHLPLFFRSHIRFYKLLGTGRNGGFDKRPNWAQWGILVVVPHAFPIDRSSEKAFYRALYGRSLSGWIRCFRKETIHYVMEPVAGHGTWDGKAVFGSGHSGNSATGPIAVLTRATIRLNKLKPFWSSVNAVAERMQQAPGLLRSYGIGEMPLVKQGTFSIWESAEAMKRFAYQDAQHKHVIQRTRSENWYSEELFMRFSLIDTIVFQ